MEPAPAFGPRLRQERERRQISLTSIAENTKISRSLLEALERDDVSRWPHGIFSRAFVRSYAEAIGLNPDYVVREFTERFAEPGASPPRPTGRGVGMGARHVQARVRAQLRRGDRIEPGRCRA